MFLTTLWKYCTSAFKPVPIAVPPNGIDSSSVLAVVKRFEQRCSKLAYAVKLAPKVVGTASSAGTINHLVGFDAYFE